MSLSHENEFHKEGADDSIVSSEYLDVLRLVRKQKSQKKKFERCYPWSFLIGKSFAVTEKETRHRSLLVCRAQMTDCSVLKVNITLKWMRLLIMPQRIYN